MKRTHGLMDQTGLRPLNGVTGSCTRRSFHFVPDFNSLTFRMSMNYQTRALFWREAKLVDGFSSVLNVEHFISDDSPHWHPYIIYIGTGSNHYHLVI